MGDWSIVVGTGIGASASIITTLFVEAGRRRTDRDARKDERAERERDLEREDERRREAFHREQIAGAQAALADLWTASTGLLHLRRDVLIGATAMDYSRDNALVTQVADARGRALLFAEAIRSDVARGISVDTVRVLAEGPNVDGAEVADASLALIVNEMSAATEVLGEALRELYRASGRHDRVHGDERARSS